MIGTIIMIWFVVMGCYYLCVALLRLAIKLPAAAVFVVCLPAMPFIVAYRNRQQHPIQTKILCWLWGVLYAVLIPLCFIGSI
ncbi:hypothetical protein [Alistipes sp.]|uniref:hypothetical protein n=1 Tax=Alistipes sp. TaxID=1872444 RepID=UPI003AB28AD3